MTTTLTNEQITAGAAVLGDDGQPIGRNTAIMVFDAMTGSAAPVAATEQATDDDLTDVLYPPRAALKAEDWDAATRKPKVKPATPRATPADAGAGLIVKTWVERMGPDYKDGGADLPEEVAMKAEIAELREVLTRMSKPTAQGTASVRELLANAETALDMAHSYVNDGGGPVDDIEDASVAIAQFLQGVPASGSDERELFEAWEVDANVERDGDYYVNPCTQSAWDGWKARAKLAGQSPAPVTANEREGFWAWEQRAEAAEAFMRNYADANMEKLLGDYDVQPIIRRLAAAILEWQKDAVKHAPEGCAEAAPVTAEPVAYMVRRDEDGHVFGIYTAEKDAIVTKRWCDSAKIVPLYATPAPADRDAIRNEALEEAARLSEELYESGEGGAGTKFAAGKIRALKSMERAADAAETRDAKGGE